MSELTAEDQKGKSELNAYEALRKPKISRTNETQAYYSASRQLRRRTQNEMAD